MKKLAFVYSSLFEKELINEIQKVGILKSFEKGETIINYSQELTHIPLVLDGALKVFQQNDEGDELLLYYLESGDTCSMSLSCCIRSKTSEIRAESETQGELLVIPTEYMSEWIVKYQGWRSYIFDSYQSRFNELLASIDQLAFHDMKGRITSYLREKVVATKSDVIKNTHQDIANEMNTSRVVVSRLLKRLEKDGQIVISRNSIHVLEF